MLHHFLGGDFFDPVVNSDTVRHNELLLAHDIRLLHKDITEDIFADNMLRVFDVFSLGHAMSY